MGTWYGSGERWDLGPEKVLRLRDDIELEACEIIWKEFAAAMKEAFAPIDSESKEG
jgi:hypothetical protein